jgi:hypothetical protein
MAKTRFHSLLEAKINEAVQSRAASLASGAAPDYPQYQNNVGYIIGLKEALNLADEVEREMDA